MNRIMNPFIAVALLALVLVSCQAPQTNVADVRKTIEDAETRFLAAFNSKDIASAAGFYAPEAILLPPNGPSVSGRENIETVWKGISNVASDLKFETTRVDAIGDLAYEVGTYTATVQMPGMAAMVDNGKYLTVWKRQPDGKWLAVADSWNTNLPPPMPPPAETKKKK